MNKQMWKKAELPDLRLSILYSFIISALMIFQSIVLYHNFHRELDAAYEKNVSACLEQQMVSDNALFDNIYRLSAFISNNAAALELLEGNTVYHTQTLNIFASIKQNMEYSQNISNVWLYNKRNDLLYSFHSTCIPMAEFQIQGLKKELQKGITSEISIISFAEITEYKPIENKLYYIDYKKSGSAVIIEIDYQSISDSYNAWQSLLGGRLIVTNRTGDVIFGGDFPLGSNLTSEEIYTRMPGKKPYVKFLGEKSLFHRYASSSTGLTYFVITAYHTVHRNTAFSFRQLIVLVNIIISLNVILIAFIWFRKTRTQLLQLFRKAQMRDNHRMPIEKERLVDYVINANEPYSQQISECLPKSINAAKLMTILIISLDIDDPNADFELFQYGIDNMATEIFGNYGFTLYNLNQTSCTIEYIAAVNDYKEFLSQYQRAATMLSEKIMEYAQVCAAFSIAHPCGAENLSACYDTAVEISEYKFIFGKKSILDYTVLKPEMPALFEQAKHCCDIVNQTIFQEPARAAENLDNLFDIIQNLNITQARDVLWQFILSLHDLISKEKKIRKLIIGFHTLDSLKYIEHANSIDDIYQYFKDILESLVNQTLHTNQSKIDITLVECQRIIEQNYSDPLFCVETIAERFNISVHYLGRKFRNAYGTSIAGAITNKRLEAAEQIILKHNDTIKNIAKQVGFLDSNYFSVLFKKKYGCSPSVYKQALEKKQSESKQ